MWVNEPLKIPWLIDCYRGFNPTWFTGDYFLAHCRETVFNQLVFHEMGKRGIFNGSNIPAPWILWSSGNNLKIPGHGSLMILLR